jgi:hypothetical protein
MLNGLMNEHFQQTAVSCACLPLVIVAQDSMILEYTDHDAITVRGSNRSGNHAPGIVL